MHCSIILFLTSFILLVQGHPFLALDFHVWRAPKQGDLRGPCPGLNALSNHGYLPRDGKGITISQVLEVSKNVYNYDHDTLLPAAHLALLTSGKADTFTLRDLAYHNTIEHDTSLSRADLVTGDNFSFNATIFKTLESSNPGKDYYDPISAGKVQKQRLIDNRKVNPGLLNTPKEFAIRTLGSSLYLSSMGDENGKAPKRYVTVLFKEERIPYKEGWRRPRKPITNQILSNIQSIIVANSDWTVGPGEKNASIAIFAPPNGTIIF